MDDSVQCWSNFRVECFKIWCSNSSNRTRRFDIIHRFNHLHFFDSQHSSRRKHTPVLNLLPTSECCWVKKFVKMRIRNLQSLLVCTIILWTSSLTRVDEFWLTVVTGISDHELVFGFHSSHVVICVLTHQRSMDWTVADKVLKKTPMDLQKRFPKHHACPKYLAAYHCGSALPENGLAFRQDLERVGKTVCWLVAWDCPLRTDSVSLKSLESFIQLTSFCSSRILAVSSRIVSRYSINFLLENPSNVDPWNRFNSSISLRLFIWASRRSRFCSNNCSWRSCWSRRICCLLHEHDSSHFVETQ